MIGGHNNGSSGADEARGRLINTPAACIKILSL
jgi:hypothetical protein